MEQGKRRDCKGSGERNERYWESWWKGQPGVPEIRVQGLSPEEEGAQTGGWTEEEGLPRGAWQTEEDTAESCHPLPPRQSGYGETRQSVESPVRGDHKEADAQVRVHEVGRLIVPDVCTCICGSPWWIERQVFSSALIINILGKILFWRFKKFRLVLLFVLFCLRWVVCY